jgi:hypothetical protein
MNLSPMATVTMAFWNMIVRMTSRSRDGCTRGPQGPQHLPPPCRQRDARSQCAQLPGVSLYRRVRTCGPLPVLRGGCCASRWRPRGWWASARRGEAPHHVTRPAVFMALMESTALSFFPVPAFACACSHSGLAEPGQ